MICTYLRYNWNLMWKRKSFLFVFWGLMIVSIAMPFVYVLTHWGAYSYMLPSADTLFMGNGDSDTWMYIKQLYPFFIVLPFGFSYIDEKNAGVDMYIQTRGERRTYYISQLITCFLGTAFVFLIPFLMNVILNGIMFPITGNSYIATTYAYDTNWVNAIVGYGQKTTNGWILKSLAIAHPQWYNVFYVFILSIASGVMGMLVYAISVLVKRNRLVVLIINYLLFKVLEVFSKLVGTGDDGRYNFDFVDYLCNGYFVEGRNYLFFILFLIAVLVISIVVVAKCWNRNEE